MEDGTYCAGCQRKLDEPDDLPVEEREPCPDCGTAARYDLHSLSSHVGLADTAATVSHGLTLGHLMKVQAEAHEGAPAATESAHVRITVPTIVRTLAIMEPTDLEGSYTAMVYDDRDRLLAVAEDMTRDDAILAVFADDRLWD